jgi:ubiquinone/menaquinone biosynthesis C-methylase UbiE
MGLYDRYVLPWLTHVSMQTPTARKERERYVPLASGRVLEIGMGSGLNLPFYGSGVARVTGIEPSAGLRRRAEGAARRAPFPVEVLDASAEAIPLPDGSFDTVVTSWTLCTIPDAARALREMRRVLVPGGRLVFVEHGLAPDAGVRAWQRRLEPLWQRVAGGCHLTRPIEGLVRGAGFRIDSLETGYAKGPRPMAFLYRGVASP